LSIIPPRRLFSPGDSTRETLLKPLSVSQLRIFCCSISSPTEIFSVFFSNVSGLGSFCKSACTEHTITDVVRRPAEFPALSLSNKSRRRIWRCSGGSCMDGLHFSVEKPSQG